ncbi:MAG: phosphatase PAP2 family protein [bacterium]
MSKQSRLNMLFMFIALCILTLPFYFFNSDIDFQKLFFDAAKGDWIYGQNRFVQMLYKFGTYPVIIMSISAIFVFAFSFGYKKIISYRKPALFLILLVLIAPGLIINIVLKQYSGRPRPREIIEFGGSWHNKKPFDFGTPGKGASFPCGHASAGFAMAGVYFLLRKKHKKMAAVTLVASLAYGTSMGIGRSMQGAHFLSDTLWAGGLVMLTGEALYGFMRMEEDSPQAEVKVKPFVSILLATVLILATVFLFLVATPFSKQTKDGFEVGTAPMIINIISPKADINITANAGNEIICEMKVNGFGLPKSDYKAYYNFGREGKTAKLDSVFKVYGLFSELNVTQDWSLPADRVYTYNVDTAKGNVSFAPQSRQTISGIKISAKDGDVYLTFGKKIKVKEQANIEVFAPRGKIYFKDESVFFKKMTQDKTEVGKVKIMTGETKGRHLKLISKEIIIEGSK